MSRLGTVAADWSNWRRDRSYIGDWILDFDQTFGSTPFLQQSGPSRIMHLIWLWWLLSCYPSHARDLAILTFISFESIDLPAL